VTGEKTTDFPKPTVTSVSVKGPLSGLDDLVWHSTAWAARKPFIMQGMPPFLTMRVDDVNSPFDWIHVAMKLA
jgi:hypothetical protein